MSVSKTGKVRCCGALNVLLSELAKCCRPAEKGHLINLPGVFFVNPYLRKDF